MLQWCSQKKKKEQNLLHCRSVKSPGPSEPCKCVMYLTARKVATWLEFLQEGTNHSLCQASSLLLDSVRSTSIFTLVDALLWYFIFISCACTSWTSVCHWCCLDGTYRVYIYVYIIDRKEERNKVLVCTLGSLSLTTDVCCLMTWWQHALSVSFIFITGKLKAKWASHPRWCQRLLILCRRCQVLLRTT